MTYQNYLKIMNSKNRAKEAIWFMAYDRAVEQKGMSKQDAIYYADQWTKIVDKPVEQVT